MRILTFNSHQPYLHLLATALPWSFGVITPTMPSGRVQGWDPRIRPIPENMTLFRTMADALGTGPWDWALTHNVHDLIDCRELDLPKVFLVHGTISGRILQDGASLDARAYANGIECLLRANSGRAVFISELKKKDWGISGDVIVPGIDLSQYGGYSGETRGLLQVANNLRERGAILGWAEHLTVTRDLPVLLLGRNSGLSYARSAASWEDLKEQYRTHRIYLHTAVFPHEDGYNLAMLEAMATGMPVASMAHPTSPIKDGVHGTIHENAETLRMSVLRLLDQPAEASRMGSNARDMVAEQFSISAFREGWEDLAASL